MQKIMFNDRYRLTEAVLEGRKTQTRRVVKCPGTFKGEEILPRYKAGEIVAVAQSYSDIGIEPFPFCEAGWRNKMFVKAELMPHQIKITNIRIQRLQDISEEDCLAEGVITKWHAPCSIRYYYITDPEPGTQYDVYSSAREAYAALIDKVSGKGTWESNPWVFVYEFELVK